MDFAKLRPRLPAIDSPNERPREAVIIAAGCAVTMLVVAAIASTTHQPFIYPSLGASAYLMLAVPQLAPGSTRNTLCAHIIGLASGATALWVFGLISTPPDPNDFSPQRIGAVTAAVGLTALVMMLLRVPHPPAIASALIVSLSLLRGFNDYLVMTVAVIAVVLMSQLINRLRGIRPPIWGPKPAPTT